MSPLTRLLLPKILTHLWRTPTLLHSVSSTLPLGDFFFLYHACCLKACVICVGGPCFAKKKSSLTDLFVPQPRPVPWDQSADLLCPSGKRNILKETGSGRDRVVVVFSCGFMFVFCFWFAGFAAHSENVFVDCVQARGERYWLGPSLLSFSVHWLALMWVRSRPLCFEF